MMCSGPKRSWGMGHFGPGVFFLCDKGGREGQGWTLFSEMTQRLLKHDTIGNEGIKMMISSPSYRVPVSGALRVRGVISRGAYQPR